MVWFGVVLKAGSKLNFGLDVNWLHYHESKKNSQINLPWPRSSPGILNLQIRSRCTYPLVSKSKSTTFAKKIGKVNGALWVVYFLRSLASSDEVVFFPLFSDRLTDHWNSIIPHGGRRYYLPRFHFHYHYRTTIPMPHWHNWGFLSHLAPNNNV